MFSKFVVKLTCGIALAAVASLSAQAREVVSFAGAYGPGTIVVKTNERRLYFVQPGGTAIRYTVGVGRAGKQWAGAASISGKYLSPDWSPPAEIRRDKPGLPQRYPRRFAEQSNGRGCDDAVARRICDPRHECAGLNRRLRVLRLHPHAQSRHRRSVRPRRCWHDRRRNALIKRGGEPLPFFCFSPDAAYAAARERCGEFSTRNILIWLSIASDCCSSVLAVAAFSSTKAEFFCVTSSTCASTRLI